MDRVAIVFFGCIVLAAVVVLIGLVRIGNELELPGKLAAIEQLRLDVQHVKIGENEDVIGQVTQWNQEIRSFQRYRRFWWGKFYAPRGWESVDIIEIPQAKGN